MDNFSKRQIELVEFAARVYHSGLRHTGINGSLYENKLIQYLREDLPEFDFYRGQIKNDNKSSSQYDIIICKKGVEQREFLKKVDSFVNIVDISDCLGVIELKKWGNPKMVSENGPIHSAFQKFKDNFPNLKYFFVTLRFKDRKRLIDKNWIELSKGLEIDGKFCFFGNVYDSDKEWEETSWINKNQLIKRNISYLGEYKKLIEKIKTLPNKSN